MLSKKIIGKSLTLAACVGAVAATLAAIHHQPATVSPAPAYGVADLGPVSDETSSDEAGAGTPTFRADLSADFPFTYAADSGSLPLPGRGFVSRLDVSARSVGFYRLPGDARDYAFTREHGWARDLGSLSPEGSTRACSINTKGDVVGWSVTDSGIPHAFALPATASTSASAMRDLAVSEPGLCSIAQDINNTGVIVGSREVGDGTHCHAFLLAPTAGDAKATPIDLGTLGGNNSRAYHINSAGVVVGSAETSSGKEHAFIYDGTTMRDLNDLAPVSIGWEFQRAYTINDHRQIAGVGLLHGERHTFALTPNPGTKTP